MTKIKFFLETCKSKNKLINIVGVSCSFSYLILISDRLARIDIRDSSGLSIPIVTIDVAFEA
jgi:hypothetical protein